MEVRFCLLQVPRIWLDGKEITFPLRRAEALIFYLVCNKTATREEIISLLWDHIDQEAGRRNLRNLLYVIKKTMGIDFIISSQKTRLSLNPDIKVDCDYLRFMECGDYMSMHGPFLNGFGIKDSCAFDEWVDQTRSRIRTQCLAYLTDQVKSTTKVGVVGRAERCALEYLQRNPSDEQMVRFLMTLYQSQARYFDGIQIYQQLYQYLSLEMGITPLAETVYLYRQMLKEWNMAVSEPSDLTDEEYLLPSRQNLMHHMLQTLFPPKGPQQAPRSIWIKGRTGTGKSFLARQYLKKLGPEVIVLQSKCLRSNRHEKFSVWQPIVASLNHIVSVDPQSFSTPAGVASEQLSAELFQNTASQESNAELLIGQLLRSVSARHRILILFDDIQWADADSILLLYRLLKRLHAHPLFCLLLGQDILPPSVQKAINALKEDFLLDVRTIHNFSPAEVQEYIQSNLNSKVAELAAPIFEATEGNPYLLHKMILSCSHDTTDSEILLQQIGQIHKYRLEMLSSDALELITWVAFFPKGASEAVLYCLLGQSPDDFRLALDEAFNLHLLQTEESSAGTIIVMKDEQCRRNAYRMVSLAGQKERHRQIGRVLEQELIHTNEFRQVEYHYRNAHDLAAVMKVQNAHCKQFLTSFTQTESDRFFNELYCIESEIAPDLWKNTATGQGQLEDAGWISLLSALCALFSGRHQEAFQKLQSIFEVKDTHRYSLFHTTLTIISYWAWKENCGNALANGVTSHCPDMMSLLKGELYSIAGNYSSSEAVLLATEHKNDPFISGYANYLLGLNDQRQNKIEAGYWYNRAISKIADTPIFWGISHIYRDTGRWALAHHKELPAQALLKCALHLATETHDQHTLAIAQAYLAALIFAEGNGVLAAQLLQEAQTASAGLTALEQGAVCLSKAKILCSCEQPGNPTEILCNLVTKDVHYYARRGLMLLYPLKDVNLECFMLQECFNDMKN